ncbi:hypothetical protein SIN8267_02102 [Sinobacterium norvegicum]|uniref:RCK C-terminal domain-containing protein n=1 Tax=Sinobacterium norvegicum TaxID=1641715 RepID=A0ABM9AFL0_9GAMM|nr:SLC13 family permease [Sinobacterium norvegicum]CAH0991987.1 hypothetical protein SIN8267_02102 [Sinobacterium norvegicum]
MPISAEITTTLFILALVLALLTSNRYRIDLVAIATLVVIALSQSLPFITPFISHQQLLAGFSSNAVVSIIAVMIISAGIERAGGSRIIASWLIKSSAAKASRLRNILMLTVGTLSGFMQNIGACALFIPVVRYVALRTNINTGFLMMPMGFAVILGGCITMLGNGPLIVLNDLLPAGVSPFELFEVTPIGIAILLSGCLYFHFWGHFYLPKAENPQQLEQRQHYEQLYGINCQVHFFHIGQDAVLAGMKAGDIESQYNLNIVAVGHQQLQLSPHRGIVIPGNSDIGIIAQKAPLEALAALADVSENHTCNQLIDAASTGNAGVTEIIIPPGSALCQQKIRDIRIRRSYGITPLAIYRENNSQQLHLRDVELQAGDSLLSYISWNDLSEIANNKDFTLVDQHKAPNPSSPDKLLLASAGFAIALLLTIFSPLPLSISLLAGACIILFGGVLTMDEAYQAVSWKTVMLLAGLIPLGTAMANSGTSRWLAEHVLVLLGGETSLIVLQILCALLATALSLIISNIGACIVLIPLITSLAMDAGFDPRPLILLVGVCVSNAFLLPTNQVSAIIQGPGGYASKVFIKVGAGLSLIYISTAIIMINWLY